MEKRKILNPFIESNFFNYLKKESLVDDE